MRGIAILVAAGVLVSACASQPKVAAYKVPDTVRTDCYTVDLFDNFPIEEPAPDVPAEYSKFLGDWAYGAWDNKWCHDLRITKVHRDGRVEMIDMHAPYAPFAQPATAFKRVGRIGEDGKLRFAHGVERRTYEVVGDKLVGTRSGLYGDLHAVLAQRGGNGIKIAKAKN